MESTPSCASDWPGCSCSTSSTPTSTPLQVPGTAPSLSPPPLPFGTLSQGGWNEVYFLYASPLDHPPINVRSEVEALRQAFAESGSKVRLNVGVATSRSLTKLLTLARARRGLVLHLSAHAVHSDKGELGLVLEDGRGASHIVWRQQLEDLLGIREQRLQNVSLLFLSTCWSEELAQVFVECGCQHVVALRTRIQDAVARRFAQHFYLSLGVGEVLLHAWDGARQALRIEADKDFAEQAEQFVLFGQHGAEEVTLEDLCGGEEPCFDAGPLISDFEDASIFVEMKVPPRPEHFTGRHQVIYEILNLFGGSSGRRACVINGVEGIGKTALGLELAHFAASPGRIFSCAARVVRVESESVGGFLDVLEDELECLANQLHVSLRPASGDSRGSGSGPPSRSDSMTGSWSSDADSLSFLMPMRQRLRRGFQQIERARRGMPRTLLVIDDEAGAMSNSQEIRKLLGELLEHTYHLYVLICSQNPIYKSFGTTKVVNINLQGLAESDAAKLFLQRIHRPLYPADFLAPPDGPDASGGMSGDTSPASASLKTEHHHALQRLQGHPLLRRLAGHPGNIRAVSSRVTPGGPSLVDLAAWENLLSDLRPSEEAVPTTPRAVPIRVSAIGGLAPAPAIPAFSNVAESPRKAPVTPVAAKPAAGLTGALAPCLAQALTPSFGSPSGSGEAVPFFVAADAGGGG